MKSSLPQMCSRIPFKVTMVELKANSSNLQTKVFISMVFILKVLDGTRPTKDSKILSQRSFTSNSLFFTCLLYLLLQVIQPSQDKVEATKQRPSLPTWRRLLTHAQFTFTL